MSEQTLGEALDGARIVKHDEESGLTLAWFGGHGVHAYTADGREVAFWNTGDWSAEHASIEDIERSMEYHMRLQEFPG